MKSILLSIAMLVGLILCIGCDPAVTRSVSFPKQDLAKVQSAVNAFALENHLSKDPPSLQRQEYVLASWRMTTSTPTSTRQIFLRLEPGQVDLVEFVAWRPSEQYKALWTQLEKTVKSAISGPEQMVITMTDPEKFPVRYPYNQLKAGMSIDQIKQILGEPNMTYGVEHPEYVYVISAGQTITVRGQEIVYTQNLGAD